MPKPTSGAATFRFDQMATLINDRVDKPADSGVERYVGLEHLDADSLSIQRWGDVTDVESTKLRFRPGDIIFGKRRVYQRKLAVADFEGICSAHAMVLRANANVVVPEFLPFFMQSDHFMERALQVSVGSLSPTINWTTLAEEEFTLPPIEEQLRISHGLSSIESQLACIEELRSAIEVLRMSALDDFFRSHAATTQPLHRVATIHAGGTPSRAQPRYWGGSLPWASGKDMKVRDLATTDERLSEEGWTVAKIAPQGATLIVVRGMILAHTFPVARCLAPTAFNQDLRALVSGKDLLPEYLTLWAEWAGPWFLSRTGESSHGTKRIEGSVLGSAPIPVPRIDTQSELVSMQEQMLEASAATVKHILRAHTVRQRMFESLSRAAQ